MKLNKRIKTIGITTGVVAMLLLATFLLRGLFHQDKMVYQGDNITLTETEVEEMMRQNAAMGQEKPREEVEQTLLNRNCLYYEAGKQGYTVTKKEVQEFLDKQIDAFTPKDDGVTENYAAYQSFLDILGMTNEEYWNSQYNKLKKDLVIEKYLKPLNQQFLLELQEESDPRQIPAKWQAYQDELAGQIAAENHVERVAKLQ